MQYVNFSFFGTFLLTCPQTDSKNRNEIVAQNINPMRAFSRSGFILTPSWLVEYYSILEKIGQAVCFNSVALFCSSFIIFSFHLWYFIIFYHYFCTFIILSFISSFFLLLFLCFPNFRFAYKTFSFCRASGSVCKNKRWWVRAVS